MLSHTGQAPTPGHRTSLAAAEMRRLVRDHDWARTPLGPSSEWPHPVRLVGEIVLSSVVPMAVAWGTELTLLYNDAFRAVLGPDRHREALGRGFREVFAEARSDVDPLIERVLSSSEPPPEQMSVVVHGPARRSFDVSFSAVRDEDGTVGGILLTCCEVTLAERCLAAQYAVSQILTDAATLEEVVAALLPTIGRELGWDLCEYWNVDPTADRLVRVADWCSPEIDGDAFEEVSRAHRFASGVGLPGRVWESREAVWIPDIRSDDNVPRAPAAAAIGLSSALAFPVPYRGELLGTIVCFARAVQPPDEELLLTVSAFGRQIGQFVERRRVEEVRNRLAAIVESSADAIIGCTFDGIITSWNGGAVRLYGYPPDEAVGQSVSILIPPEHEDELMPIVERVRRRRRDAPYETRRLHKGGWLIDVSVTVSPIVGPGGDVIGASVIARDISERKLADALLAGERRALEMVTRGAPLSAVLDDLARTTEALAGEALLASVLLLDADGVHVRHGAAPSLPDGFMRAIDGEAIGPATGSCGTAMHRRDTVAVRDIASDPLWADYRDLALGHGLRACWSEPIFGSSGQVLGAFALYYPEPRDPTPAHLRLIKLVARTAALVIERKDLEHQLAEGRRQAEALARDRERERDRLQQVIDELPEAIIICDRGGQVVICNRASVELVGADLSGRRIRLGDEEALLARRADGSPARGRELPLQRSIMSGEVVRAEQWLFRRPPDGRDVPVLQSSVPLRDRDGAISGGVLVFQDITALKDLEREKDDFLAAAAHDLRNPLTAIQVHAEVLLRRTNRPDTPDREDVVAGLSQVLIAAQRMSALTGQMLDLTRLQMGRPVDLHRDPTDLVALVSAVAEHHASTTKRHVIRVVADSPELIGLWDASRIERVIQNLLSNAIKFSPNGGEITVTVAQERDATGGIAVLTVRDQGIGIPSEDLPRLFDRFYRAGNVVGQIVGTGVGLTSVRQVVEGHGGTVVIESRLGHGSAFILRLPLAI
jgi:PAS domain S-box-containing protein